MEEAICNGSSDRSNLAFAAQTIKLRMKNIVNPLDTADYFRYEKKNDNNIFIRTIKITSCETLQNKQFSLVLVNAGFI